MRRFLVDSTFLRVYVLLALALLLTFGLALIGLAMVDQVRREHYREQLAQAPMQLLVEVLVDLPEKRRSTWLEQHAEPLDMAMTLYPADAISLNYFERTRLANGRVLVEPRGDHGWRLQQLLPDTEQLLEVDLTGLSEQQLRGLTELLGDWLSSVQGQERQRRLQQVARGGIPVELSDRVPEGLYSRQLSRLEEGEVVIRLLPGRWSMSMSATRYRR